MVAASTNLQHFEVIVSLLVGVLGLLGSIRNAIRRAGKVLRSHVSALQENTKAIEQQAKALELQGEAMKFMGQRLTWLEDHSTGGRPPLRAHN